MKTLIEKIKAVIFVIKLKIRKYKVNNEWRKVRLSPLGRELLYYLIDKYLNHNDSREPNEQFERELDNIVQASVLPPQIEALCKTDYERRWFAASKHCIFLIGYIPPNDRPIVFNLITNQIARQIVLGVFQNT